MKCWYHAPMIVLSFTALGISCYSQEANSIRTKVGGPCEGCKAIYEYGSQLLTPVDTLPAFKQNEPKLKIIGTVFGKDEETPAEDIIIYIYHTNREGIYETDGDEKGWGKRHGYIRGWVKTSQDGAYTFYTFRPAAYPSRNEPEHIHITVKEPDKNEYYIDEFVFHDDPLLTKNTKTQFGNRGGSGIVSPVSENGMLIVERDIILGKNIPDYD